MKTNQHTAPNCNGKLLSFCNNFLNQIKMSANNAKFPISIIDSNMKQSSCGYDSIQNQIATRRIHHGLSFNVLVVGPTGIGKTTLIQSLFDCVEFTDAPDQGREIGDVTLHIKESKPPNNTVDMKVTIIETKGFDNQVDKSKSYKPIVDHITARYDDYLNGELVNEKELEYNNISDNRIHCCIYMIAPTGNGLKPIDLVTMKQLHHKVCLIPVIGKSDVLTRPERLAFKEKVRQEITTNGIEIYSSKKFHLPFAIAASNELISEDNKRQRVRLYPWGKMYIEKHTEFLQLRELITRSDMLQLIEYTNKVHYAKYRREVTSEDSVHREEREAQMFRRRYETEKAALERELEKLERFEKLDRLRSPLKRTSMSSIMSPQ